MSILSDILDDVFGFDKPNAPAPIAEAQPDLQEVVSAGDRARKKKTTQTTLGGNTGQPTISAASLYGM